MCKYKFEIGDDFPPAPDDEREAAIAGITGYEGTDKHTNRVEIYGLDWDDEKAFASAKELRDFVMKKLCS